MPRTTSLPTPASSTDIKGQDGCEMASLQLAFELPPPAVSSEAGQSLSNTTASFFPTQASETVKSRKRLSTANPPKDQFALPPPPTRSRKIIQMKPREEPAPQSTPSNSKTAAKSGTTSTTTTAAGTKRKHPSATSAAGRKIARKTAHSLIERRRRSKMNEEFAVLKSLIPACTGEMHKLAILQASIDYVRYLEDCITKLKAQVGPDTQSGLPSPALGDPFRPSSTSYSPDVEMTSSPSSSTAPSPTFTPIPNTNPNSHNRLSSISPALLPQPSTGLSDPLISRHNSHASILSAASTSSTKTTTTTSTVDYRLHHAHSHSYGHHGAYHSTSATTSPIFGPQPTNTEYLNDTRAGRSHSSSLISRYGVSPMLLPQSGDGDGDGQLDREATAALLMLNQVGRGGRGSNGHGDRGNKGDGRGGGNNGGGSGSGSNGVLGGGNDNGSGRNVVPPVSRGMSVRDLLSS